MPRDLIFGTAGHIDHGKTSLVKALTGVDTDRLPEEKARGITIDIGFAILDLGDFRLGIVDVPGHERFIKNMLAGATGIDLAVLVVAADDSVMPQTREHLEILRLLGLRHGVIALTKTVALEYAARGITANTIPPFTVDTPMLKAAQEAKHLPPSEVLARMVPAGRLGTGDDIAAAARARRGHRPFCRRSRCGGARANARTSARRRRHHRRSLRRAPRCR